MAAANNAPSNNRVSFSLDLRMIVLLLLAVIAVMLFTWKPWNKTSGADRTVEVTGEAKLTDKPDEFVFYPSYPFKNENKDAALADLTKKSDEVVGGLKKLGVPDNKIKTDSSGYDYPVYYDQNSKEATYTLSLTVTVNDKALAQKVEDYIISTTPSGAVTPQAQFSDKKRKELESKARDEATKDARAKANQSAKNLGFKVAKIKSITDGTGFGPSPYLMRGTATVDDTKSSAPSLSLQPGENDLNYSVTVVYLID